MALISPLRWAQRQLNSWLGDPAPQAKRNPFAGRTIDGLRGEERKTLTEKQQTFRKDYANPYKDSKVNETLRMALMGIGPGWWVSDHAEEAQHFTGWNYAAIHAKAKQAMMATARVYRKVPKKETKNILPLVPLQYPETEDDKAPKKKSAANPDQAEYDRVPLDEDHPASKLLRKPNPRWMAGIWRYMIIQQMDLTGTALLWKVRDQKGDIAELWVIPYALARPQAPTAQMPEGAYWVTATGLFTITGGFPTALGVGAMAGLTIDARDTHVIGWPHAVLQADRQSPVAAMSVQIDLAEETDQAAWAVMNNAVDPSTILKLDANMQVDNAQLDAIEAKVNANRAGMGNKGKFWVIQGCEAQNVGRAASELDYADSRPEVRNGVLAGHGVAPIFCGITEAGSYSAFFAALTQTIEVTVQPELDLVAGELTRLIQKEFEEDDLEVIITAKSFNDPEVTESRRKTNILARSVTINEDRKMMGLEPVPWGDVQIGTPLAPANIDTNLAAMGIQKPVGYPEPIAPGRQGGQAEPGKVSGTPGAPEVDLGVDEPDDKPSATNTGLKKPVARTKGMKKSLRPSLDERMMREEKKRIEEARQEAVEEFEALDELYVNESQRIPSMRDMLDKTLLNGHN